MRNLLLGEEKSTLWEMNHLYGKNLIYEKKIYFMKKHIYMEKILRKINLKTSEVIGVSRINETSEYK